MEQIIYACYYQECLLTKTTEITGYVTQLYMYWLLGCFSADVKSSARTGGLFRCFETAGQAISHGINSRTADKRVPLYINIAVYALMLPTISTLIRMVPDKPARFDDIVEDESSAIERKASMARQERVAMA